ncbi:hypothetical protein SNEBB_006614 [Seison nebaliae]|nr:hypothetical protein SNEBB_006614 [Seison nebaliae]
MLNEESSTDVDSVVPHQLEYNEEIREDILFRRRSSNIGVLPIGLHLQLRKLLLERISTLPLANNEKELVTKRKISKLSKHRHNSLPAITLPKNISLKKNFMELKNDSSQFDKEDLIENEISNAKQQNLIEHHNTFSKDLDPRSTLSSEDFVRNDSKRKISIVCQVQDVVRRNSSQFSNIKFHINEDKKKFHVTLLLLTVLLFVLLTTFMVKLYISQTCTRYGKLNPYTFMLFLNETSSLPISAVDEFIEKREKLCKNKLKLNDTKMSFSLTFDPINLVRNDKLPIFNKHLTGKDNFSFGEYHVIEKMNRVKVQVNIDGEYRIGTCLIPTTINLESYLMKNESQIEICSNHDKEKYVNHKLMTKLISRMLMTKCRRLCEEMNFLSTFDRTYQDIQLRTSDSVNIDQFRIIKNSNDDDDNDDGDVEGDLVQWTSTSSKQPDKYVRLVFVELQKVLQSSY